MNPEIVEALINAVEKRKSIYDKTDPGYRNYINSEWKKIAEEVGCTDEEARKRWKKLRDYFLKSHREITTTKSGAAGGKKRKWFLYDRMLFVLPYTMDRDTTTNVEPTCDEDTLEDMDSASQASTSSFAGSALLDSPAPTALLPLVADDTNNPDILENQSTSEQQPQTKQGPRSRRSNFPQNRTQSDFETEMLEAAKRIGEKKTQEILEKDTDEDECFFRSLVPKMKLLSTLDKMECQAEIHMVVLKHVRRASGSAVMQPSPSNQVYQTPPRNPRAYQYNSPGTVRSQMPESPQTPYMRSPLHYQEYHFASSQYPTYP